MWRRRSFDDLKNVISERNFLGLLSAFSPYVGASLNALTSGCSGSEQQFPCRKKFNRLALKLMEHTECDAIPMHAFLPF